MANEQQKAPAAGAATTEAAPSLLDQILTTSKQTERSRAEALVKALTDEALKGTVTWSRNVPQTIKQRITAIDKVLSKQRALEKICETVEYAKWRGFRDSEDSRFVSLVMPRVLARLPYGSQTKPIEECGYEEVELDAKGKAKPVPHDHYTWMNAAYVLGTRLTDAFAKYGWCTAIRGEEGGGKVEGLPAHIFLSDDGDPDLKCPTELGITDRREAELSKLGLLPLCHYKNTDYAVFFG